MSNNAVNRPANAIVRSVTGVDQSAAIDVAGMNGLVLHGILTGTNIGMVFEASVDSTDGANGTWFPIPVFRVVSADVASVTGTVTPAVLLTNSYLVPTTGWTYFRARVIAGTFTNCNIVFSPNGEPTFLPVLALVNGTLATGAAVTAAAALLPIAARTGLTNFAARTDTVAAPLAVDGNGKIITTPFATNELTWQYFAATDGAPITTATNTTLRGAVATFRNYVSDIQLINVGATATEVVLQDTTATPAGMWRAFLPANMTVARDVQFQVPLRTNGSGTNSGVVLRTVTAGCAVHVSAQGFAGY